MLHMTMSGTISAEASLMPGNWWIYIASGVPSPFVEKLITKAKTGTLHARRLAGRHVQKRAAADKLFQELGPKYATRKGGYTRIIKTGHRKGDAAEMARIELIEG